jgi:hypothetical protein
MGRPPRLSDSELACLAVAQALLGYRSEARRLPFARRRLAGLPCLPQQSALLKARRGHVPGSVRGGYTVRHAAGEPPGRLAATSGPAAARLRAYPLAGGVSPG